MIRSYFNLISKLICMVMESRAFEIIQRRATCSSTVQALASLMLFCMRAGMRSLSKGWRRSLATSGTRPRSDTVNSHPTHPKWYLAVLTTRCASGILKALGAWRFLPDILISAHGLFGSMSLLLWVARGTARSCFGTSEQDSITQIYVYQLVLIITLANKNFQLFFSQNFIFLLSL